MTVECANTPSPLTSLQIGGGGAGGGAMGQRPSASAWHIYRNQSKNYYWKTTLEDSSQGVGPGRPFERKCWSRASASLSIHILEEKNFLLIYVGSQVDSDPNGYLEVLWEVKTTVVTSSVLWRLVCKTHGYRHVCTPCLTWAQERRKE